MYENLKVSSEQCNNDLQWQISYLQALLANNDIDSRNRKKPKSSRDIVKAVFHDSRSAVFATTIVTNHSSSPQSESIMETSQVTTV